jgi:MYXO-CTERM domain-containing protein
MRCFVPSTATNFPRSVACIAVAMTACASTTTSAALWTASGQQTVGGLFQGRTDEGLGTLYVGQQFTWSAVIDDSLVGANGAISRRVIWASVTSSVGTTTWTAPTSDPAGAWDAIYTASMSNLQVSWITPGGATYSFSTYGADFGGSTWAIGPGSWSGGGMLARTGSPYVIPGGYSQGTFEIVQGAAPAPGAFALLGIAGLAGGRRRRS